MNWERFFKAIEDFDWFSTLLSIGLGVFVLVSLVRWAFE